MVNDYKEKIFAYLNGTTESSDIEKIRISCGIGNWNTALKHCLELHFQGKIQGQKTSKGWIFWTHQEKHLKPWEEAIGKLDKVENSETQTIALLTCTYSKQIAIALPKEEPETQELEKLIGCKIGILKTDNPDKPIIIRTFTETPATMMCNLWLRQLRRSLLCYAFKGYALKFSLWLSGLRLSWWF
jgi:hypothetical protein